MHLPAIVFQTLYSFLPSEIFCRTERCVYERSVPNDGKTILRTIWRFAVSTPLNLVTEKREQLWIFSRTFRVTVQMWNSGSDKNSFHLYGSPALSCYIRWRREWVSINVLVTKFLTTRETFFRKTVVTVSLVGSYFDNMLSAGSLVHRSFTYASLNIIPFLRKTTFVAAKCDPTTKCCFHVNKNANNYLRLQV